LRKRSRRTKADRAKILDDSYVSASISPIIGICGL
jgi:hypothetical protein